jgi:hypothetical protein
MNTASRLVLGAVTAALMVAGAGTALANTGSAPTPQPGPITLTPQESAYVCNTRIPNALKRIEKLTSTASASATTRGSTAWLQAKENDAKTAGKTDLAAAIQKRIDARPGKLAKLADAQKRLQAFQSEHCS